MYIFICIYLTRINPNVQSYICIIPKIEFQSFQSITSTINFLSDEYSTGERARCIRGVFNEPPSPLPPLEAFSTIVENVEAFSTKRRER